MPEASSRKWTLPISVAALTGLSVFVLPFLFPPSHPAYSQAYVVGFNNRVAIFAVAAISAAVGLLGWWRGVSLSGEPSDPGAVPVRYLSAVAAFTILGIGLLSVILIRAHSFSNDDQYFVVQMQKVFLSHQHIYSRVEFVYGPLLFYPTLWLAHLGGSDAYSLRVAYYVTLVLDHLLGLGMLYVIINRLPLDRAWRRVSFVCMGIFCCNPWMGLSYTYLRFLAPVFFLALMDRIATPWRAAIWAFVSGAIAFCISPEIGIAHALGVVGYGVYSAVRKQKAFLSVGAAVVAGLLTAAFLAPRGMMSGVAQFSAGGFHHVVLLPSIALLYVLAAIVWLAPRAVAERLCAQAPDAALLSGMYVSAIAMLPAMLGPEESMHALGNGVGFVLLAAVYASTRASVRRIWILCTVAAYLFFLAQTLVMARPRLTVAAVCASDSARLRQLVKFVPHLEPKLARLRAIDCPAAVQVSDWRAYIGAEPFTIFSTSPNENVDSLAKSDQYRAMYYAGNVNMNGPAADELVISELRQVHWAFLDDHLGADPVSADAPNSLELPIHFKERHRVLKYVLLAEEVNQHWTKVAEVSPSLGLYKRVD